MVLLPLSGGRPPQRPPPGSASVYRYVGMYVYVCIGRYTCTIVHLPERRSGAMRPLKANDGPAQSAGSPGVVAGVWGNV